MSLYDTDPLDVTVPDNTKLFPVEGIVAVVGLKYSQSLSTYPEIPEEPLDPDVPLEPLDPEVPEEPSDPVDPELPLTPDVPEDPLDPELPDVPDEPSDPVDPELPLTPDVPEDPLDPEVPESPEIFIVQEENVFVPTILFTRIAVSPSR